MPTDYAPEVTVVPTKTVGISPKAILATALPALGTVMAVIVQWVVTGEYDQSELVTSLVGFIGALTSGLGAWLGQAGTVAVDLTQHADVGEPSDSLLPPSVKAKLESEQGDTALTVLIILGCVLLALMILGVR